ncbi:hypothetical protein GPECTOR_3g459 [Gonium pectorale]|uniref:Uncharacterized protein n=1 Tax=Gonium pectorale TaxID=33097 RepID=A0A150GZI2_GONPE|nr:hypothetical protein GPECTOR_3g459 [Gonium pectorale]|eukprot:KXZ55326.1 hypothetical protein GPECTOR_3g459 [Gonium pectorale]
MAFRARRFNGTGSASEGDLSGTVAAANAGAGGANPDHSGRRSGSESPIVPSSNPAPLQPSLSSSGVPPPPGRQLSSGSLSSVPSNRPSPNSGASTILASFSGTLPD